MVDESNINYRRILALKEQDSQERDRGIREHNQLRYVAMTRFEEQVFVLTSEREPPTATKNEQIQLPSAKLADPTKAIEILGKVSPDKVEALRSHLETNFKPLLENDKSNYSPGRQVAWVSAKWDLKEKDFKPGVQDDKLMQLAKQVYPDADIVLVTYSAYSGAGINYHRDDSYAATEARSINIGNSEWGYRAAKEQMAWTKDENKDAQYQEFKLESGTVTRFNCKNEHAALNTEAGRWSINIWSIKNDLACENGVRQKFENFIASNQPNRAVVQSNSDLTIKSNEWTPGGEIKVERSYSSLSVVTSNVPSPAAQTTAETKQLSVEEIIATGNRTAARAAQPQIPENPTITGKPVPMVYLLHMHGEASKVPVNTTIDAMRGHGRVHTTRGVDYQKVYGIKEGDIAVALGKNGEQVAFRVGKQYEITPQIIQNPAYQQAWANWEKHSAKELTQNQASKNKVYGLFIEPLGDYVNGKIVPFPSQCVASSVLNSGNPPQDESVGVSPVVATGAPVNISPDSSDGLGAALSLATALAKEQGKLQKDYQVSVNNNPEAAAGQYGLETHPFKPEGISYTSAEQAFHHQKQLSPSSSDEYKLMVTILEAKLEQHPRLTDAIAKCGGTEWLENCTAVATTGGTPTPVASGGKPDCSPGAATHCLTNITDTQDKQWEGKGKESTFIRALSEAYNNVVEKSLSSDNDKTKVATVETTSPQTSSNPLAAIQPINNAVAEHMKKDIAMAEVANQFIGKSAAPPETVSSTRNYEQAWGENANTGNYSKDDIIMVSGSGPWRGVSQEQINQTFKTHYKPLLDKAIEAKSSFVVGNAKGTDQLVQKYLQEKGYKLEQDSQGYAGFNPVENTKVSSNTISCDTQISENTTIPEGKEKPEVKLITISQEKPVASFEITSPKVQDEKPVAPGINFNSRSPDPLGAVLTSTTVKSKQAGTVEGEYTVSFRDNQAMPAGNYGPETYTQSKPEGQPFLSAEQAFYAYKETVPLGEPRVQLMAEILTARFEQHPKLVNAVTDRGGVEWLEKCKYEVSTNKTNFWEGSGQKSPYIRALTQAYTNVAEKIQTQEQSLSPNPAEPAEPPQQSQKPDIEQAFASPTSTYSQQVGVMDGIIERMKANTVQNLQDWHTAAQKLGKSEKYLSRIQEVTNLYIKENISLENSLKAMEKDVNELEKVNEMTSIAQRIVKTIGQEDINGIMSVQTENYQIATKAQDQTYLVKDKKENVLLYVKEGKTQVNNITEETLQNFRFMNFKIDNALKNVKKELEER